VNFDDNGFPIRAGACRALNEAFAMSRELPICLRNGQCLFAKQEDSAEPGPRDTKTLERSIEG
jgi:hypothetical protein